MPCKFNEKTMLKSWEEEGDVYNEHSDSFRHDPLSDSVCKIEQFPFSKSFHKLYVYESLFDISEMTFGLHAWLPTSASAVFTHKDSTFSFFKWLKIITPSQFKGVIFALHEAPVPTAVPEDSNGCVQTRQRLLSVHRPIGCPGGKRHHDNDSCPSQMGSMLQTQKGGEEKRRQEKKRGRGSTDFCLFVCYIKQIACKHLNM